MGMAAQHKLCICSAERFWQLPAPAGGGGVW